MPPPTRAAQYVRMSTDHQRYSIEGQIAHNAAYATERGFEAVRIYKDSAISGLTLHKRPGLKSLLTDILSGAAEFNAVLIYDISRWGRFQDLDESAHYEFVCRAAGVPVIYTAEPFNDDGALVSVLFKQLKRAVAAQHSQNLARDCARAIRQLRRAGYWSGGAAPFGYQRWAVDDGGRRRRLHDGEWHANTPGTRTILIPGPPEHVAVVENIYRWFVEERLDAQAVAARLNETAAPLHPHGSGIWSGNAVRRILHEPLYAGVVTLARTRSTLGVRSRVPRTSREQVAGAVQAIVSRETFRRACSRFPSQAAVTRAQLLAELRRLVAKHTVVTVKLVQAHSRHAWFRYRREFGSLRAALEEIGYQPTWRQRAGHLRWDRSPPPRRAKRLSDDAALASVATLLTSHGHLTRELINVAPGTPSLGTLLRRFGSTSEIYRRVGYQPGPRQSAALQQVRRGTQRSDTDCPTPV